MALAVSLSLFGNIRVVDNTPGSGAQYTTLQSAINSSTPGDTVLIQPSPSSYGNATVNKRLVLIGPGHQAESGKRAEVGTISVGNNSDSTEIVGLFINALNVAAGQSAHNIRILRNYLYGYIALTGANWGGQSSNNWLIEGNVIVEQPGCGGCIFIQPTSSSNGWLFKNNIIQTKSTQHNTNLFTELKPTFTFYNNIFIIGTYQVLFNNNNSGALFQNNVFWVQNSSVAKIDSQCVACQFNYNLTYSTSNTLDPLTGNNNLDNVDPQFLSIPSPGNAQFTYENDYHFMAGSPAATGASNGGMLGIYGGSYPFNMYGHPTGLPRIVKFVLEDIIIPPGTNVDAQLKAIGNTQ